MPTPHLLLSSLKMPHRVLVVIRTHDSLITALWSSRKTVDAAGGGLVSSDCGKEGDMHIGPGHKLAATKRTLMCVVFLPVSSVGLLRWLLIIAGRKNGQPCAT